MNFLEADTSPYLSAHSSPRAAEAPRPRAARRLPTLQNVTPWVGEWIGSPDLDPPGGEIPGLDGEARRHPHETLLFRVDLALASALRVALLRVASDSRHVVWVNGHEAIRGPMRSQPSRLVADEVDIADLLRPGDNVIAVRVTYFGSPNALWMPARSSGGLGTAAALLAELRVPEMEAVLAPTGSTWQVLRSHATRRLERSDVEGVPAEIHDARLLPVGWQVSPLTAQWLPAVPLPAGHISAAGRTRPPADPYGCVPSRRGSRAEPVDARPTTVLRRPVSGTEPAAEPSNHPSDVVRLAEQHSAAGIPAHDGGTRGSVLIHDFGRVVFGHISLAVEAAPGVEFDLDLREDPAADRCEGRHGLRYIARGSDDHFLSAEPHGLRAIAVRASGTQASEAIIRRLSVRDPNPPPGRRVWFTSSDSELDAIWRAGLRTLEVNSSDAYIDCPTREQRAWVGDGSVHQEVDLYTNSDVDPARRYVELCASPTADGLLPMAVAGDIEDASATTIPSFSLFWVHGVHTYALHQGVDEAVREALPVAERVLRWFDRFRDAHGTLTNVPGWGLVDWSSIYTDGRSSVLTALWVRALREFAALSSAVGNAGSAQWARRLQRGASAGFESFWDAERGLYLDRAFDGTSRSRATSQLASASALVAGLVPRNRRASLARRICDPTRVVTRSWLWNQSEGFNLDAMGEWMNRPAQPDWDVDVEIVRAQPFGLSVVHDALGLTRSTDELLASIRSWSTFLTEGYDTFGEGWGWGTRAHGWSSTPTRDLIAHVLGARPHTYGGSVWTVEPALGSLERAHAGVETAHGLLEIEVDLHTMRLDSPVVTRVRAAGVDRMLPPGQHAIPR